MASTRHTRFEYRAPVPYVTALADAGLALGALFARAPTDRVGPALPFGLTLRDEPPWFLAVAAGALLGLGILGHTLAAHAPRHSLTATVLAAVLDGAAVASALRLAMSVRRRAELLADGRDVLLRVWLGARVLRERRVPGDEVTAVLVLPRRRVVLVGGRNAELLRLYAEGPMDPPALARWLADAAALVAGVALSGRSRPAS